jgi:hypothetical protein
MIDYNLRPCIWVVVPDGTHVQDRRCENWLVIQQIAT